MNFYKHAVMIESNTQKQTSMLNVLLVEDDERQALRLAERVENHTGSDFTVVGPYSDFGRVLPAIKSQKFQMALIDIELHQDKYAGIHIAEAIQEFHPVPILFISGVTERHVVEKAGEVYSSDFLQKPYDEQSLSRALDHSIQRMKSPPLRSIKRVFRPRRRDWYWIKSDRSVYVKVDPRHIVCVEALDHHCRFYVRNHPPIIACVRLKSEVYEGGLEELGSFYLLNRSTIINLDEVDRVEGNNLILRDLKLFNRKNLIIPKERRKEVLNRLGITIA